MKLSAIRVLYFFARELRALNRNLRLIAAAQCKLAGLNHPDLKPNDADFLFAVTDRDGIAIRREKEQQDALFGIHAEDGPAAR